VTEFVVDSWDLSWKDSGEPGDDPRCPYYDAHRIATQIERDLAAALGVNWKRYDQAIGALRWRK